MGGQDRRAHEIDRSADGEQGVLLSHLALTPLAPRSHTLLSHTRLAQLWAQMRVHARLHTRRKFLVVVDRDANRVRKFVTSQHQGLSPLAGRYNTTACHNHSHVDGDGTAATFCRPESVTASADGSRVVVAEALEHYGSHDMWRRCREGGGVE